MPPIVTTFKSWLWGSAPQKKNEILSTADRSTNNAGTAASRTANTKEAEANEIAAAGQKRSLDTELSYDEEVRKRTRRSDRPSEHERRLLGDYNNPQDARRITFPSYDGSESDREAVLPASKMPHKVRHSGFRPQNSLNQTPHAGNRNGFFRTYGRQSGRSLETESIRGSNVKGRADWCADGFVDDHQIRVKRQKLDHRRSSSPFVDLTDDSNGVLKDRQVDNSKQMASTNGRTPSPASANIGTTDYFGATEFYKVDEKVNGPRHSHRPKSRGASQSSQRSGQRTPVPPPPNGCSAGKGLKRQEPVVVLDDERPSEVQSTKNLERTSTIQAHSRLPIDLDREPPPTIRPPLQQGSAADLDATNVVLISSLRGRAKDAHLKSQDATSVRKNTVRYFPYHADDGAFISYAKKAQEQEESSEGLRSTFIRDAPRREVPARQKALHRMQPTSHTVARRVSPVRDSFGSTDELQGENTILHRASRSISPHKKSATTAEDSHANDREQARAPSISDLKETEFITSGRKKGQQTKAFTIADADEDAVNYVHHGRIPISAIFCRSCVSHQKGLELVWEQDENTFYVECGGEPCRTPGKGVFVHIGDREAKEWHGSQDSLKVQIKGSVTSQSSGTMLIELCNRQDILRLLTFLQHATDNRLSVRLDSPVKIDKIFANLVPSIIQDYKKEKWKQSQLQTDAELELAMTQKRHGGYERGTEERIIFEDEGPHHQRTSARMRMQEDNSTDGRGSKAGTGRGEVTSSQYFPPRRSTRMPALTKERTQTPPLPPKWSQEHHPEPWKHSVVYPPVGTRRVTVDFQDLERLDEGEFLNDNVISFALRLLEENMAPEHKDEVHFFNTFFYSALTTKNGRKVFNYDAVKRWTKNKDIFTVPYVVVPINIDLHWFVAIICNLPSLSRKPIDIEGEPENQVDAEERTHQLDASKEAQQEVHADTEPQSIQQETAAMHKLSLFDRDVYEFDDDDKIKAVIGGEEGRTLNAVSRTSTDGSSKKSKKRIAPPLKRYDPDTPVIITLDSFGSGHSTEIRNLKDYLQAEADAKRGMDLERTMLQGMTAKGIPEQTNFCDCGVYLVGYIEQFAKDPRRFINKVLSREMDQQADFANFTPSEKRAEIRTALLEQSRVQEAERKAKKKQKSEHGVTDKPATVDGRPSANVPEDCSEKPKPANIVDSEARKPSNWEKPVSGASDKPTACPQAHRSTVEEDGDALDMAPARPLTQEPSIGRPSDLVQSPLREHDSPSSYAGLSQEEEDGDEMLDHPVHAESENMSFALAEGSLGNEHLLQALSEVLAHEQPEHLKLPTEAFDAKCKVVEQLDSAVDNEKPDIWSSQRSEYSAGEPKAEIEDSQEQPAAAASREWRRIDLDG